jgi:hypothetical protein
LLGNNPDGSDLSAVVDQVSGPAAESGKIQIGHFLVSVNGQSTLELNYYQTLSALKNATRPITLDFCVQIPSNLGQELVSLEKANRTETTALTGHGDNYYEIELKQGPLGILLTGNPNGPDLSAAVAEVPEQSQAYGRVKAWDYLIKINDTDTSLLHFTDTMTALKKARRPVTLGFVSPPRLPTPKSSNRVDAFTVYPTKDPTKLVDAGGEARGLSERCILLVGPDGIHIVTPGAITAQDATVAFWKWDLLRMHKGQRQSEDPNDMELFMFVIEKIGMLIFEVNDQAAITLAFANEMKKQRDRMSKSTTSPHLISHVPGAPSDIQHTGPRRKKTQANISAK